MTGMLWFKAFVLAVRVFTYDDREPSDRLVPVRGEFNLWGPEGTRLYGDKIPWSLDMKLHQMWGDHHLRDGDLVHRLGDARLARGLYPFSRMLAKVTDSRYSHTGIVAIEGGHAVVYDATKQSIRRQPFGVYMIDNVGSWCVQRAPSLDAAKAVAYVRGKWHEQPPFDYELSPDDRAYYCVELAVKGYRAGGVDLGGPTMVINIPGIRQYKVTLYLFMKQGLRIFNRVWYIGNRQHGILGSSLLTTVHEET